MPIVKVALVVMTTSDEQLRETKRSLLRRGHALSLLQKEKRAAQAKIRHLNNELRNVVQDLQVYIKYADDLKNTLAQLKHAQSSCRCYCDTNVCRVRQKPALALRALAAHGAPACGIVDASPAQFSPA